MGQGELDDMGYICVFLICWDGNRLCVVGMMLLVVLCVPGRCHVAVLLH